MLWPAHPHPFRDELLSSWLVRVAHANGLKVQTFCDHQFGSKRQIWNRDIDRLAPTWLIETMSDKTATPLKLAINTTLQTYEGVLYDKYHPSGQLRWILPLQIYHRKRHGHGIQFCPQCLTEDADPYYRRSWRIAFHTFCSKHRIMMLDRCPHCGNGIAYHRLELGKPKIFHSKSLANCESCSFDLRDAPRENLEINDSFVLSSWTNAIDSLTRRSCNFDFDTLKILHHFCALLVSVRLAPNLQKYICTHASQQLIPLREKRLSFEQYPLHQRHHVLLLAWWLMGLWPSRIRLAWEQKAIRYSELTKDFTSQPKDYCAFLQQIENLAKSNPHARAFRRKIK